MMMNTFFVWYVTTCKEKKEREKVGVRESYFASSIICLRLTDEKGYSRKSREREREVA